MFADVAQAFKRLVTCLVCISPSNRLVDGQMDGRTDRYIYCWMDGLSDGRMNPQYVYMDGWLDDVQIALQESNSNLSLTSMST